MYYKYNHCEQYYKRSILDNGNSFLGISQNGSNELTEEEQDNEEQEEWIEEMNDSDLTTISFN